MPEDTPQTETPAQTETPIAWEAFLRETPPGEVKILQVTTAVSRPSKAEPYLSFKLPRVRLSCPQKDCGSLQSFEPLGEDRHITFYSRITRPALSYGCRNC